jgi:molecular chaperone DnaJ
MNTESYYEILGVNESANQDDIKKAYRKLAKEKHPDVGGNEDEFKKISDAYDTLGDENKRRNYDNRKNNPFSDVHGFDDIFNMFNQRRQKTGPVTKVDLSVGVLESYKAIKKVVSYKRNKKCDPCQGSGGKTQICKTCNGEGVTWERAGNSMFVQMVQKICSSCSGYGKSIIEPCFVCNGSGTRGEIKQVEIKLPHGVDNGQFVKLSGMGDYFDGIYGDLIVRINLTSENNFDKYQNHLTYNAFLNLEDIKTGSITVSHPDGDISVKLPKKFDTSIPLRVKSKGFKYREVGDLIINQYVKFNRD